MTTNYENLSYAELMQKAASNASVQAAQAVSIDRYTLNSEWETIAETFLHNLSTTIRHIKAGTASPEKTPFVRRVCKDGDTSKAFSGVFLGYAKDKKVKNLHSFENPWFQKHSFGPVDAPETLEVLEAIQNDTNTQELALSFLRLVWETKVTNGQKGREKATANVAHFASQAVYEGAYVAEAA